VHTASTTSFTVVPTWFFSLFTSSKEMEENATFRCAVIAAFIDVLGAVRGSAALPVVSELRTLRTSRRANAVFQASLAILGGFVRRVARA
jgi:hypothetical protein